MITLKDHSKKNKAKYFAINLDVKKRAFAFDTKEDLKQFITDEKIHFGKQTNIESGELKDIKHQLEDWKIEEGNKRGGVDNYIL